MKVFIRIFFSFAPHIFIPVLYILLMTGKNGIIKKLENKKADTKVKNILYGLAAGVLSVGVWFCGVYAVMNVFLVILNLIPGVSI